MLFRSPSGQLIALTVKGLPPGVEVPANLVVPGDKAVFPIPLQTAKDAGTVAGLVTIEGTADLAPIGSGLFSKNGPPQPKGLIVTRTATARASGSTWRGCWSSCSQRGVRSEVGSDMTEGRGSE